MTTVKTIRLLIGHVRLYLQKLKVKNLYSLPGHRVVSSFTIYISKPIRDYNLILLIAINKSVFVIQQRGVLFYCKLSKLVDFTHQQMHFYSFKEHITIHINIAPTCFGL